MRHAIVLAVALSACSKKAEPTETGASASATTAASADLTPTGIDACDAYIRAADACMKKAAGTDRENLRISIEQQQNQVQQARTDTAREAVSIGCEAELEALEEDPTCTAAASPGR